MILTKILKPIIAMQGPNGKLRSNTWPTINKVTDCPIIAAQRRRTKVLRLSCPDVLARLRIGALAVAASVGGLTVAGDKGIGTVFIHWLIKTRPRR